MLDPTISVQKQHQEPFVSNITVYNTKNHIVSSALDQKIVFVHGPQNVLLCWQSFNGASHCRWSEYHKKGPETDHNESLAKVANRIPINGVILKRFRIRMRTRQRLRSFFFTSGLCWQRCKFKRQQRFKEVHIVSDKSGRCRDKGQVLLYYASIRRHGRFLWGRSMLTLYITMYITLHITVYLTASSI